MEMEQSSGSDHHPAPFFPWDLLPFALQESILSLLPVSTLALCQSVSRSWRSTIRSPTFLSSLRPRRRHADDLYLILFTDNFSRAAAYRPSGDRWLTLALPPSLFSPLASAGGLVVAEDDCGRLAVYDLFSGASLALLPNMASVLQPYALALIDEFPWPHYTIVAVSTGDRVYSQVFDSRSGRWELKGQFPGRFAVLGNAVLLDGLLLVLSQGPDHLLTFDPIGGEWNLIDVAMPPVVCSHIFDFENCLFLVGGVEEVGCMARVGIWELDWPKKEWRLICFMPDGFFRKFGGRRLDHFETVARRGIVCFYNTLDATVLMFDLPARRWWWPPPCDVITRSRMFWFGHAIEPRIDLLKGSNGRFPCHKLFGLGQCFTRAKENFVVPYCT
ncbi:F-box/kelch-repeat protein At5g43190-like [Phoenix dactylifera]|uniref:F-box/kelch-repeat protein At5g43190-like n=1 Tax=Phoenix dactylifera TaxID=42345 RepID=A0A8B8ZP98_PHODC|nr:F-box/kelch-repeat protein At5g43190-like [Phoenix dactylifera]XP_038976080.1 F-box/kelch-repeat protein At5g43190-like [Phoenix dactylifera]